MTEKYRYYRETMEQKDRDLKNAQSSYQEINEAYGRLSRDFDSNLLKLNELQSALQNHNNGKFEEDVKYWQNELRLQENINHEVMQKYNEIVTENTKLQAANDILEKMNRSLTESNISQQKYRGL